MSWRTASILCFSLLLAPQVVAQEARPATKSVLLLLPEDMALPAMTALVSSLRASLWESWGGQVSVDIESLDLGWFSGPEYERALLAWYLVKYRERQPDALITFRSDTIHLTLELRQKLWPDIPVIVLSEDERLWERQPRPERVVGQWLKYDMRATAELALRLMPDTRRLAFVNGSSPWEQAQQERMLRELRPLLEQRGLEFIDLSGLSLAEMLERVGTLPADTVVLTFTFIIDSTGRPFVPREVASMLLAASNRPCFTVHETVLGMGFVGGVLVSYEAVGQQLGMLTARMLRGEQVDFSAPLAPAPVDHVTVDARALRRWGITPDRVPPGVRLAFEEPSLWERYRLYVLGAITVSALQTLMAVVLMVERRRRIRVQAELNERHRLEKLAEIEVRRGLDQLAHVSRVAALGEMTSSLAHELNQPLAAILVNAQAVRRLLDATPMDLVEVREAIGDIISDDKRAGEVIRRMRTLLKKGQPQDDVLSLNDLVREVARLVANDMQLRGAELHMVLAPSRPAVRGDGIQLQQVMLNLLINALEATSGVPAGQRHIWVRTTSSSQEQVELSVQDSGAGIEPSHLPHVFEPFYSTKKEGLGMGLSISRSIVVAHGGQLWAESPPGQGALLRCVLPVAPSNASP
ncbi:phospho-acceptor domain-containing protein [Archangium gephyra]|uniref:histidine kinase n=1 Tax=Archangium gephyra TaxID=48 RepID=A0AAC8Q5T2_9BACT|nr:ATP-binding protein [Archangium gephyra]AKJ01239.1 Two-component oxygen-sensor histidine kinase FixL [Archangium gephyra]REG24451.1 phospho-acceptor domain-containing protein [Archangium gephyra]